MNKNALATRLGEYIGRVSPDAHGHQQKAVADFVLALVTVQSYCQATLARFFDNFEAASKRLSCLLHNARLLPDELALAHARALCQQLPLEGCVRLSLDWTTEDSQSSADCFGESRAARRPAPLARLPRLGVG